jgi:hypothetical protein
VIFNEIVAFYNQLRGKTPLAMGDLSKHTNNLKAMGDGPTQQLSILGVVEDRLMEQLKSILDHNLYEFFDHT